MLTSRGAVQRRQKHAGPRQGSVLGLKNTTFFCEGKKHLFLLGKPNKQYKNIFNHVFYCGIISRAPKAPSGKICVFECIGLRKNIEEKTYTSGRLNKKNPAGPPKTGFGLSQNVKAGHTIYIWSQPIATTSELATENDSGGNAD